MGKRDILVTDNNASDQHLIARARDPLFCTEQKPIETISRWTALN